MGSVVVMEKNARLRHARLDSRYVGEVKQAGGGAWRKWVSGRTCHIQPAP